jgi:hypothetical protein
LRFFLFDLNPEVEKGLRDVLGVRPGRKSGGDTHLGLLVPGPGEHLREAQRLVVGQGLPADRLLLEGVDELVRLRREGALLDPGGGRRGALLLRDVHEVVRGEADVLALKGAAARFG